MKHLLITAAVALAAPGLARAQMLKPAQVSAAARATFKARFPAVQANTWEKEGDKYEAGFKLHGTTMSALITPAGELVETESDTAPGKLPAPVRAALTRDYKAYKITEAATLVSAGGATTYEAEVSRSGKKQDVVFNADGTRARK